MTHDDLLTEATPAARYERAILDGDYDRARDAATEALDAGLPPSQVLTDVLAPSMRRIGDLWEQGVVTTADEHLATAITERVLADLYRTHFSAAPRSRETVLVTSVDRETHVLGTRMIADVLEGAGFRVVFLGGDLPVGALIAAIERHRPAALLLGATFQESADSLRVTCQEVRVQAPDLPILVGGPAAQTVSAEGGNLTLVPDATQVVAAVEEVLDAR